MDIFKEWKCARENNEDDHFYKQMFIKKAPEIEYVFLRGNTEEIENARQLINDVSAEELIETILENNESTELSYSDIPCFSNFYKGTFRTNEILEFKPEGISIKELGYQLIRAQKDGANIKYGENHSKLAQVAFIGELSHGYLKQTTWGYFLNRCLEEEKFSLTKKVLLTDPCIQAMIKTTCKDDVKYSDVVCFLSKSTAYRRRTNVRFLVKLVLQETKYEWMFDKINWEVE